MIQEYLSMAQAAQLCTYDQEYLGLLARRGILQAQKINRKWYTTQAWLNNYLKVKRPNEVIQGKMGKNFGRTRPLRLMGIAAIGAAIIGGFFYWNTLQKISQLEQKASGQKFILNEIVRIPDDSGRMNTYGNGMVKISPEAPLRP